MSHYHVDFIRRPSAAPYMEVDDESIAPEFGMQGSFAQLLRAQGLTPGDGRIRKLAIKAFVEDPEESGVYQDVEKEYNILTRLLGSSHSAQLYGMGYLSWDEGENEDQMLCLVESYAPGIRMDKALAASWFSYGHAGDPTPKESLGACVALAEAVSDVAAHGVVNRDLGPDNVFFSREGRRLKVTLIDFGNGQKSGGEVTPTPRAHLAKWQYGAPEVYPGCEYYDERTLTSTDVYSLGALCYRLLSGRVPFPGIMSLGGGDTGSYSAVLDARRGEDGRGRTVLPEACVDSLGSVGSHVSDIVAHCMSYNPGDRPSARDVCQALMRCLDDLAATPVMPNIKATSAVTPDARPKPSQEIQPKPIPVAQPVSKAQPQSEAKAKMHAGPTRPPAEIGGGVKASVDAWGPQPPKASTSKRHDVAAESNRQSGRISDQQKRKARKARALAIGENIFVFLMLFSGGFSATGIILELASLFLGAPLFLGDAGFLLSMAGIVAYGVALAVDGIATVTATSRSGEQTKKTKGYLEIVASIIFIIIGMNYGNIVDYIVHFISAILSYLC